LQIRQIQNLEINQNSCKSECKPNCIRIISKFWSLMRNWKSCYIHAIYIFRVKTIYEIYLHIPRWTFINWCMIWVESIGLGLVCLLIALSWNWCMISKINRKNIKMLWNWWCNLLSYGGIYSTQKYFVTSQACLNFLTKGINKFIHFLI